MTPESYAAAYADLYTFTVRLLRTWDHSLSREQAEDLAQDVWLRIWATRAVYRADCSIKTWAGLIAYRTLARRNLRTLPEALHEPANTHAHEPDPTTPVYVAQILARCPALDRALLVDLYMHGTTYVECGQAMGWSVGAVRRLSWEARKTAREAAA